MSLLTYYMRRAGRSLAEQYRDRVLAAGGTVFSMAAVEAAYAQAETWELPADATHWTSPQFGYHASGSQLDVRYCLFGHDATSAGATTWILQPGAPGKAPQHYTTKAAFNFPALAWSSLDLLAHTICQPVSWQSTAYPYFPLIESSGDPLAYGGFLLAGESGVMEGGYADTAGITLAQSTSLLPIGALATLALQVDTASALPARRRVWANAAEALTQVTSGQPALTTYPQEPVYLGARGLATQYAFDGNINDLLVTNKVLPDAARLWLDSQKNAY